MPLFVFAAAAACPLLRAESSLSQENSYWSQNREVQRSHQKLENRRSLHFMAAYRFT